MWVAVFGFGAQPAAAQGQGWQGAACVALNRAVLTDAAAGKLPEAEAALSGVLASNATAEDHLCAGVVLSNVAALLSISGRLPEAEMFAERSIHVLEQVYAADDPAFLRPLHVLASARIERGEIGKAREAFKRMQALRIERPEDRALFHGVSAALLNLAGRRQEAESEYALALDAWEKAGRGGTADYGSALNGLAAVFIAEGRLDDARRTLDRALDVFSSAANAVPMDRFKLLATRAVVHARLREWRDAEQDLRDATAMAEGITRLDPVVLGPVLTNYAYVLRKNHHREEARVMEARAAALRGQSSRDTVVDTTELLARSKRSGK